MSMSLYQQQLEQLSQHLDPIQSQLVTDIKNTVTTIIEFKRNDMDVTELEKKLVELQKKLEQFEPILQDNPQRFVILPIQYHGPMEMYKKAQASFWTAEEITLTEDLVQWKQPFDKHKLTLSDNDRYFIKHILAFFASFDGIINENLAQRFYSEIQIPEARLFYGFQIAMEGIHGETYSLFIDTFVEDKKERETLFRAVEHYPSIKKMADWAMKYVNADLPFNQRLIAFACVEGILFSAAFCAIFWLKKRGLLPGLAFSNELISRDEALHMDFACMINSLLVHKADPEKIVEIVVSAVDHGKEFITASLPCNLIGMNCTEMTKYVEYVADQLLVKLGVDKHYNTLNPFDWMDLISAQNKSNMFERRVGNYNKAKFNSSTITSSSHELNNDRDNDVTANNGIQVLEDF